MKMMKMMMIKWEEEKMERVLYSEDERDNFKGLSYGGLPWKVLSKTQVDAVWPITTLQTQGGNVLVIGVLYESLFWERERERGFVEFIIRLQISF